MKALPGHSLGQDDDKECTRNQQDNDEVEGNEEEKDDSVSVIDSVHSECDISIAGDSEYEEEDMLAAFEIKNPMKSGSGVPGCYYKYRQGICTREKDGTCKLDHSEEGMRKAGMEAMRQLVYAKNSKLPDDVRKAVERAIKDSMAGLKAGEGKSKRS